MRSTTTRWMSSELVGRLEALLVAHDNLNLNLLAAHTWNAVKALCRIFILISISTSLLFLRQVIQQAKLPKILPAFATTASPSGTAYLADSSHPIPLQHQSGYPFAFQPIEIPADSLPPVCAPQPEHSVQQSSGLDFDDHEQAYRAKPTLRLLRTLAIFGACGFPPFVRHALDLYKASRNVIGQPATNAVVRQTFFKQFCGGADPLRNAMHGTLTQFNLDPA